MYPMWLQNLKARLHIGKKYNKELLMKVSFKKEIPQDRVCIYGIMEKAAQINANQYISIYNPIYNLSVTTKVLSSTMTDEYTIIYVTNELSQFITNDCYIYKTYQI